MSDYEIIITSGRGPEEVRSFVAKLADRILRRSRESGLAVLSVMTHGPEAAPFSVTVCVAGAVPSILRDEWGTHSLVMRSAERGRSSRKRWYAGVACRPVESEGATCAQSSVEVDASDLSVQACRSGGPGGQHVNKTNSAVMVLHKPSGIRVRAEGQRSQSQNRREAMLRIAEALSQRARDGEARRKGEKRTLHHRLERGAAVRTYCIDHQGRLREQHAS